MPCHVRGRLERQSMNRSSPAFPAALVSAAALGAAAALLRRLLRHRAVEQAVQAEPADRKEAGTGTQAVPAGADADSPAEAPESNETDGRPARTWVVDNSSNWDGSPLELVVPPGNGSRAGPAGNQRRAPGSWEDPVLCRPA